MNRVYLIGNLTRDPELAVTNSGVSVCRFSIAVSRRFSNAEGEREADFFNIVVWRAQGENCHKDIKKVANVQFLARFKIVLTMLKMAQNALLLKLLLMK